MFTTIVVPLDGSDFAAGAIPIASSLAYRTGSGIRFVGIARDDSELDWVYEHVHTAVQELGHGLEPAIDVIVDPDPVAVLLGIAADNGNILCFASHDRRPVAARLMHSVGSELVARSQHPIVVVGNDVTPNAEGQDVVVALDGVEDPEPLLQHAIDWAQRLDAGMRLVTVYEPVLADLRRPTHFTRHHGPPGDPDAYLDEVAQGVAARGFRSVSTMSIADPVDVAAGLANHLAVDPAQLLVVGSRRQGPHFTQGIVRELLRTAASPVLVINRPA
jgi:nucleotide-binding universal stress UspA family protein